MKETNILIVTPTLQEKRQHKHQHEQQQEQKTPGLDFLLAERHFIGLAIYANHNCLTATLT